MNQQLPLRIFLTTFAMAVICVHLRWPALKIDAVTLGLIAIALLPWLSSVIKSVEVTGVGKVEFQEVKNEVEEMRGAIQSVGNKAEFAVAAATETGAARAPQVAPAGEDVVGALAQEYAEIRRRMPSGPARTAAMTSVVRKMIASAPGLPNFDVEAQLEGDGGRRLFAYAYLYALPDLHCLKALVHSLVYVEDTPFGQYWGIEALGKLLGKADGALSPSIMDELRDFLHRLGRGTDRYYELKRLLPELETRRL